MILRFCSGSVTPVSSLRNRSCGLHVHQRNIVVVAEQRDHALGFAEAQQPVINEHAGELIVDRLVDEDGGDGGIDAAGKPADHLALADLLPDLLDRLLLEGAHGPVTGAAGDLAHEVAKERRAVRGVYDLEVELHRVELALIVGDHGDRRIRRRAGDRKTLR